MEKYGVVTGSLDLTKTAADGCPKCGSKVERHGNVLLCPKCGTVPFEGGGDAKESRSSEDRGAEE